MTSVWYDSVNWSSLAHCRQATAQAGSGRAGSRRPAGRSGQQSLGVSCACRIRHAPQGSGASAKASNPTTPSRTTTRAVSLPTQCMHAGQHAPAMLRCSRVRRNTTGNDTLRGRFQITRQVTPLTCMHAGRHVGQGAAQPAGRGVDMPGSGSSSAAAALSLLLAVMGRLPRLPSAPPSAKQCCGGRGAAGQRPAARP